MFNPLEVPKEDVEQLFKLSANDIKINGKPSKGIITEFSYYNSSEDKNLHTLDKITTGDYIEWQDETYLIINETVTRRHHKYKTLIRHCNYDIKRSRPRCVVDDTVRYNTNYTVPCIFYQKSFTIDGQQIRVGQENVEATMQDTEENRKSLFAVGEVFVVKDTTYKVINHDVSVRGVLTVVTTTSDETKPKPIDKSKLPRC